VRGWATARLAVASVRLGKLIPKHTLRCYSSKEFWFLEHLKTDDARDEI